MGTNVNLFIALVLLTVLGCSQKVDSDSNQNELVIEETNESTTSGVFVSKPMSHEDSVFFESKLSTLRGIEKYAIGRSYYMLSSVLGFKGEEAAYKRTREILESIEEYPTFFQIMELDVKNGYIVYAPVGAEVTYTKVYWNLKDGSQLIALESYACGPICESEISFVKHKDGAFQNLNAADIIPEINKLPPMIDKNGDPVEYKFVLPQEGKDIKYCLAEDCITLKWNEGTFEVVQ
ncbi:MAG: hypothetical protein RIB47_01700 [Cyclobacteriaceae bacterium]